MQLVSIGLLPMQIYKILFRFLLAAVGLRMTSKTITPTYATYSTECHGSAPSIKVKPEYPNEKVPEVPHTSVNIRKFFFYSKITNYVIITCFLDEHPENNVTSTPNYQSISIPQNIGNSNEQLITEEDEPDYYSNISEDEEVENFTEMIKKWAISFNISQAALKELIAVYNHSFGKHILEKLPTDPRTLLRTPQKIEMIVPMDGGSYWYPGVKYCLELYFKSLDKSISISLNINIDGIPIYKSSKTQFWPILFTVHEIDNFVPMVAGIYCGDRKPASVQRYLQRLVEELQPLIEHGLTINNNKLHVKIRCFICDAPARSMIKGKFVNLD